MHLRNLKIWQRLKLDATYAFMFETDIYFIDMNLNNDWRDASKRERLSSKVNTLPFKLYIIFFRIDLASLRLDTNPKPESRNTTFRHNPQM